MTQKQHIRALQATTAKELVAMARRIRKGKYMSCLSVDDAIDDLEADIMEIATDYSGAADKYRWESVEQIQADRKLAEMGSA